MAAMAWIARIGGPCGPAERPGAVPVAGDAAAHARTCVLAFAALGLVAAQAPDSRLGGLTGQ